MTDQNRSLSLFLESESFFYVVTRGYIGDVDQVFQIFYSEETKNWAVFTKMAAQARIEDVISGRVR